MAKAGDRDVFPIVIRTEDVLGVLGVGEVAASSASAMTLVANKIIIKSLKYCTVNIVQFIGFTAMGLATAAVQMAFDKEIKSLKDMHIDIFLEARERKVTKQGKVYTIIEWVAVDFDISVR